MIANLLIPLAAPFGALAVGYAVQRVVPLPAWLPRLIMTVTAFAVWPVVSLLSFWVLVFPDWRLALLPVVGGLNALACLIPAWWLARWHQLTPAQTGSYLTCALFSNVGYIGQFIIFALYGELALALTMLYMIYFSPIMYSVGMGLAQHYGAPPQKKGQALFRTEKGPGHFFESAEELMPQDAPWNPPVWARAIPFVAMGLGLLLNAIGLERPAWLGALNQRLVPLSSMSYLCATGLTLQIRTLGRWHGPAATLSLVKFVYAPLVGLALAWLLGFPAILGGLPVKVVVIEAMMPVALSCMMLAGLFRLDQAFATAMWLANTLVFLALFAALAGFGFL